MNSKKNCMLYFSEQIDYDGSLYLEMLSDVQRYDGSNAELNKYLNAYRIIIGNKGLYIKGNYLCFTYNNTKYFVFISSYSFEWEIIPYMLLDIANCGVQNVYYKFGELD